MAKPTKEDMAGLLADPLVQAIYDVEGITPEALLGMLLPLIGDETTGGTTK